MAGPTHAGSPPLTAVPDARGRFGAFGGAYVPETLMEALRELDAEYERARKDPAFQAELDSLLRLFVGRPTPTHRADRLSRLAAERAGKTRGATIWLKREDLAHTGAHKINNTIGQGLLTVRMGKKRVIAETGAGQHGVATATACARLGLSCEVYMGAEDVRRQHLNVVRMRLLGAKVVPVESGSRTLKDATNEAMRDWVTNVRGTHYILGSALGSHPYPMMVRDFHRVIGQEVRAQILEREGRLPDEMIACVGGGSNAIGFFFEFLEDTKVRLVGVEAGGRGIRRGDHAARFEGGKLGVLQGCKTYILQNDDGQIELTHSVSAGLDYAAIGPEHAFYRDRNRIQFAYACDDEVMEVFQLCSRLEGIIPALESTHALVHGLKRAKQMRPDEILVINLSGRGDKDVNQVAKMLGVRL